MCEPVEEVVAGEGEGRPRVLREDHARECVLDGITGDEIDDLESAVRPE